MSDRHDEGTAKTERRTFSYFVNTMLLAGAAVASQFINFGGALINARLYGPSEFGLFGLFMGVLGLAMFAASWRYEIAIVTTDDEEKAQDVVLFVLAAGVASALLFSCGLLVIEAIPGSFSLSTAIRRSLIVVPILLLLGSAILAGTNLCVRRRQFVRVAVQQVMMGLATVGAQVALFRVAIPGGGLVAGFVVGQAVAMAVYAPALFGVLRDRLKMQGARRRFWGTARDHHRYFFYVIPYSLMNQLYVQGPVFLLGALFSPVEVGLFSLAFRTTTTPLGLLPAATAQVLFPELARDHRQLSKWGPSVQALFAAFGLLYAPAVAAIIAFGPDIYAFGLGERWRGAGVFAQIIIVPNMLVMLCSGYDRIYFILNHQKTALLLTVIACIPSAGFMWLGYRFGVEPTWPIVGWAAAQVTAFLVWIGVASYLSGFSLQGLAARIAIVIGSIIVWVAVLGGAWQFRLFPVGAVGFLFVAAAIYAVGLWRVIWPLRGLLQRYG